ncbi:recombinase family protein [Galbibacter sp. BG1]
MLAIYVRLSKEDEDSNSISHQQKEGIKFAEQNNIDFKIYNEGEGVSGTNEIEQRPILSSLMGDINKGNITHVWMRNQNRLERNGIIFFLFTDVAKKNNVKVYFGDNEFNLNNPTDFLHGSILSAINSYQAQLQSYQTKKVLANNVSEGKAHGILPYGYITDENGYMVVDEDEAKVVKQIFELSLNGNGTNKIAEILNSNNIPTRYNKLNKGVITTKNKYTGKITINNKKNVKWAGNTIRNIIINEVYIGKRIFGGKTYNCPAILSQDYFNKVNMNLKNNRNNTGKKVEHKYLLKGLLTCGKCGRNMYGRSRVSGKDNFYMCSSKRIKHENCNNRSINITRLEFFITQLILNNIFLTEKIKNEYKKDDNKLTDLNNRLEMYENNISNLNNKKNRAIKLTLDGVISEEDIKSTMSQLNSDIEAEKIKIKDTKKVINNINDSNNIIASIEKDISFTDKLTFQEKKEILNKYIDRIIVISDDNKKEYMINIQFKMDISNSIFFINYNYTNYTFNNTNITELVLNDKIKEIKIDGNVKLSNFNFNQKITMKY